MFSSTVSRPSALVSWKVRTMPLRATLYAGTPARSWPSKNQVPVSGLSKPVNRLKKVVLPAPLGPMSAVITPRGISTWSTSTALMPPNERVTLSAIRIGSFLGTPGTGSPTARSIVLSATEVRLPLLAEDALWAEHDDQDQRDPHQDVPHRTLLHLGDRQQVVGDQQAEDPIGERQHDPEDDRAEDGAQNGGRTAEQHDREQEERRLRAVVVGLQ